MLSFITILIISMAVLVHGGPYRGYYSNQYPTYRNQGYGNNYYQGYRSPYQYQGYGTYYQNQGYGYGSQPSYSNPNGINYDSNGNSFIGTKDNGIYLLCNGRGCPGRG